MAFKASEAVQVMDFDLNPYVNKTGIIPEPTSDQVNEFFSTLQGFAVRVQETQRSLQGKDGEDLSMEEVMEAMASVSDSLLKEIAGETAASVEKITSGEITSADFQKLPYRVQQKFMQWLGESFRPEGQTPATRR